MTTCWEHFDTLLIISLQTNSPGVAASDPQLHGLRHRGGELHHRQHEAGDGVLHQPGERHEGADDGGGSQSRPRPPPGERGHMVIRAAVLLAG